MTKKTSEPIQVLPNPVTSADFIIQGYTLKTGGKFDDAEANFRKAISLEPGSVEAYYALGLALKAQDRRQDSIQCFEKVLGLIDADPKDAGRAHMLQRLVKAHINQLRSGDWDLEKEIWQHK